MALTRHELSRDESIKRSLERIAGAVESIDGELTRAADALDAINREVGENAAAGGIGDTMRDMAADLSELLKHMRAVG